MGKRSRDKGARGEREAVRVLEKQGFKARRVPLSGAMKATGFGGDVLFQPRCRCGGHGYFDDLTECGICVDRWNDSAKELRAEVKVRANGFKQLYKWLEEHDAVILKADRQPWLIVRRVEDL